MTSARITPPTSQTSADAALQLVRGRVVGQAEQALGDDVAEHLAGAAADR